MLVPLLSWHHKVGGGGGGKRERHVCWTQELHPQVCDECGVVRQPVLLEGLLLVLLLSWHHKVCVCVGGVHLWEGLAVGGVDSKEK